MYVFLYAPIAILVLFSFNRTSQTAVWEGFTLEWYRSLLHNDLILAAVRNSLIVGVGDDGDRHGARDARRPRPRALRVSRARAATKNLLYLPIIIPEIVIGAALVTFFGVAALPALAHDGRDRPRRLQHLLRRDRRPGPAFGLRPLPRGGGARPRGAAAPDVLAGHAAADPAGGRRRARSSSFTVSIDDYVITSFVAGVGATTLPLQIYSMLKVGVTPEVNAVSTLLLAVTVVLIVVAQRLQQPPAERAERS